jgi:large repetitive protein
VRNVALSPAIHRHLTRVLPVAAGAVLAVPLAPGAAARAAPAPRPGPVTRPAPAAHSAPAARLVPVPRPAPAPRPVIAPRPAGLSFEITTTADGHDARPGDGRCADRAGRCTLRAAVEEAAAWPPATAVSIGVPAGTYGLSLGSLDFDGGPLTLTGAGAWVTVIKATGTFRVLEVGRTATAALSGVTITGGEAGAASYGGGVLSSGHLSISDSIVAGNRATAGGGIANAGGTLTVSRSAITGNSAPYYGGGGIQNGGIANLPGTVELTASTVARNTAGGDGGGILDGQNGHPGAPGLPAAPVRSACPRIPRCAGPGHRAPPSSAGPPAPPGLRLLVAGSHIDDNLGTNSGAGIANDGGAAVVTGSTLTGNRAVRSPGGAVADYGPLTLLRDTLSGNQAAYGGALEADFAGTPGRQFVTDSTLSGNQALTGGGIDDATGTLYVTASTLAGNTATLGGGIEVEGASFLYLRSSTLTGNTARSGTGGAIDTYACGGGVVSYATIAGNSSGLNLACSNLELSGTILAASAPGANCAGAAPHESAGYNLDTGTSCGLAKATDLTAADPRLGPLAANGGPAQTRLPGPGSPAIDHGGTPATGCPAADQRGVSRPQGPACDIGAVEVRPGG